MTLGAFVKGPAKKNRAIQARFFVCSKHIYLDQKGTFKVFRSLRVSTKTKGPSSSTTAGGRSRGTRTGLVSAAMAAWTAATLEASELTQTKPEDWAICAKASMGRSKLLTVGSPLEGAAGVVTAVGAGASVFAVATGAAAAGAETGAGAGVLAGVSAATATEGAAAVANGAASEVTWGAGSGAVVEGVGAGAAVA